MNYFIQRVLCKCTGASDWECTCCSKSSKYISDDGTGGDRGASRATGPPIFVRSVNPIPNGEGHIISTYYYWSPNFFDFPASLYIGYRSKGCHNVWKYMCTVYVHNTYVDSAMAVTEALYTCEHMKAGGCAQSSCWKIEGLD